MRDGRANELSGRLPFSGWFSARVPPAAEVGAIGAIFTGKGDA